MDRKDKIINYFIKIIEDVFLYNVEYEVEKYSAAEQVLENGYEPTGSYRSWVKIKTKFYELELEYPPGIGVPEVICFRNKITGEEKRFINYQ